MEIKDIFFPVTKLPVPPDEVDLLRIVLLESVFKKDEQGQIKEFRKIYYETSFEGKKVSDGNNIVPSELIPLIFDAKNNLQVMDYAMQSFGFAIKHDVFEETSDVFQNPYKIQINNQLNTTENATITQPTNATEPDGATSSTEPDGATITPEPTEPTEPTITPAN